MHGPSYAERQSLAWLIRARLDKGFSLAEARSFVHRLLVTEVIYSERPLPPDWRPVLMGHDRIMIETPDTLEDARHFRFYYAPVPKASRPPCPEPASPTTPTPDDTPQTASQPDAPAAGDGALTAKDREKAEAAKRKAITDKRRADAVQWLAPQLHETSRLKDHMKACMKKFGLSSYEYEELVWPAACVLAGLKKAEPVVKKRPRK